MSYLLSIYFLTYGGLKSVILFGTFLLTLYQVYDKITNQPSFEFFFFAILHPHFNF